MVVTASRLLLLAAVICFVIAVIAVFFDIADPDVYAGAMALGLAFGFAGFLVP